MCYQGIDTCRQACGGAGYSAHSLLPSIFLDYSPVVTYEGDTTVMAKQNLSYIQKILKQIKKGKPATASLSYLNDLDKLCAAKSQAKTVAEFSDLAFLDLALSVRAAYSVRRTIAKIDGSKENKKVVFNDKCAQDIIKMSKVHMLYQTFKLTYDEI